ncbi:MAG: zinc-dependent alcohol dehydrogenase family protein [Gammaproteobacteria bacterium]|nr:zinc-dependent alcohol dehydrogenase family protein [Gammaproteobacteria bacterium]MDE0249356.1 zinc-dependent alcohol dehydrogenase family protein [Gammaproteobacteria bacterium]
MRGMFLEEVGHPLRLREVTPPSPKTSEVLIRVRACAVCRTDLHVVDGELAHPKLPLVPGHEIVGVVEAAGPGVTGVEPGTRVGVPWLGWTCGRCRECRAGRENLCRKAEFTGYTRNGGYAELALAHGNYVFPVPDSYDDIAAAPLLCAGLIGYRAYRHAGDGRRLGLYGFGAAAHLLCQVAVHEGREVYAFTRPGDVDGQAFARAKGAAWAGDSDEQPPAPLDAAIIFAPVGPLVPQALRAVAPGGTVVCAGIHMSAVPSFPYEILWEERVLRSVANLTREDATAFLDLAPEIPVEAATEALPLKLANQALDRLRAGEVEGALVLVP